MNFESLFTVLRPKLKNFGRCDEHLRRTIVQYSFRAQEIFYFGIIRGPFLIPNCALIPTSSPRRGGGRKALNRDIPPRKLLQLLLLPWNSAVTKCSDDLFSVLQTIFAARKNNSNEDDVRKGRIQNGDSFQKRNQRIYFKLFLKHEITIIIRVNGNS